MDSFGYYWPDRACFFADYFLGLHNSSFKKNKPGSCNDLYYGYGY